METVQDRPISVRASAFDPKSPLALLLHNGTTSTGNIATGGHQQQSAQQPASPASASFNVFLANDGIGCNEEETSALMRLIDAREKYLQNDISGQATSSRNEQEYIAPKSLSKSYRNELIQCMQQWESRVSGSGLGLNQDNTAGNDARAKEKQTESEEDSIELLKLTHTIVHLCETFLMGDDKNDEGMYGYGHGHGLSSSAGTVTADVVRYLRYNHMMDLNDYLKSVCIEMGNGGLDISEINLVDMGTLLDMDQPEYYDPVPDDTLGNPRQMTPYWCLFRKLVIRGCLNEAWAVLSRHSACKRSSEIMSSAASVGSYVDPTVREDNEAFALIRALLLSAPIPGGRDDLNDDGLGSQLPLSLSMERLDMEDIEEEQEELLGGIARDAYKQWNIDGSADATGREFNIHAILNLHKSWKNVVSEMIKVHTPLRNLTRRLPALKTCLWDVILNTSKCYQDEDVWAERLAAELIYVRPQILKEDVNIRTADHMETCSGLGNRNEITNDVEEILLEIMKGNAGVVLQALNSYGGGSSAALPATMMALLCNLLVEIDAIDLSQLTYDIETELLLSASSAILSSFAEQNHNDIGVRLSTQLLLPRVIPENLRITASVAETLCRHWPKSDAETLALLDYCKESISRGSRLMMEAADSIAFSRSNHYNQIGDDEKSIRFLLRGVESVSFFGSESNDMAQASAFSHTVCFRRLTSICATSSEFVLKQIYDCFSAPADELDLSILTKPLQAGRIIVDTITADSIAYIVESDPSVSLLNHVVGVGLSLIMEEKAEAAQGIIQCLQDQEDTDGSMIVLAHSGLYGYLLSCAFDILAAEGGCGDMCSTTSSFDLKGMQVLLSRYTQYCSKEKVYINQDAASSLRLDITPNMMREALGKGLMRAFIVDNSKASLVEEENLGVGAVEDALTEEGTDQILGPSL